MLSAARGCSDAPPSTAVDAESSVTVVFCTVDETLTRAQWLRTVAQVPIEAEFLPRLEPPVYQSIAADVAAMHERGVPVSGIAQHFGVDHHTAAKALRWFRSR